MLNQINLIMVENQMLGEWVGLHKINRQLGYYLIVIKNYGKESQAKDLIKEYLCFQCKKKKKEASIMV